ncbi:prepro-urotensin II-beta-like [Anguilla anguilla]|uniref:prepro-urotensin II-beta-like n=1 Tax=Anguilla anguilla TaxID=7936 RepID=UPI0015AEC53F|nr:prepro-urotensin II-beta-like [Anguilla anguilla]XP_035239100.1 prepro-urotensin II-beta-like [Anguilla anguilla]
MRYTEPVLDEDGGAVGLGEFSISDRDRASQSGTGPGVPALLREELHRDGSRSAGFIPVGSVKEGLLENSGSLHPFQRFLGSRKQYEKRGNPTECFWKYCV